jgi:predicted Zn-dependent protease
MKARLSAITQTGLLVLALTLTAPSQPRDVADALFLEESGDDESALGALDAMCKQFPSWALPRLEAARIRLKVAKDLDHAELDLEAGKALAPENPRAHYLWALLAQERGRPQEAIRSLETALTLKTDYTDARSRLAALYLGENRLPEAEMQYRTLVSLQPDSVPTRLQWATVLERQGQLDVAERELRKLSEDHPDSPQVRQRLATFYERTGRPELAEKTREGTEKKRRNLRPLPKSKR